MRAFFAAALAVAVFAGVQPVLASDTVPTGWSTFRDPQHGISISYPPSWRAAPKTLNPALVDPVVPIALGTYAMKPERSGDCDIVPQRALDALKPTDAFLAVYVFDGMATWSANTKRPARFSRNLPWYDNHIQCTEHVHGWVGQITFTDHGLNLAVLVAIGSKASKARRSALYRILDTLAVASESAATSASTGAVTRAGWTLVPKVGAGLANTSLAAIASNGDALLLGGERVDGLARHGAIFSSVDGLHWRETGRTKSSGEVTTLAMDGNVALAIGTDDNHLGASTFIWRSDDAGRTWQTVARGNEIFGTPALQMGRPFLDDLVHFGGWWVASGGASDGYAGVWVSRNGARWRQVLATQSAGGLNLTQGPGRSLFAYSYADAGWQTTNPTKWGSPISITTPDRFFLSSVAPGASAALAGNFDRHGVPTPLLRSTDEARTWKPDGHFLADFPDAWGWTITRADGRWIAAGASGVPNHPDAWISRDLRTWIRLPKSLYGSPGGTLSLVAELHGRIVMIGTAPELDRYYLYDTRRGA
jgi:hypothetical protein